MLRKIPFTKMHGIGNDYLYINCLEEELANPEKLAIKLSDRHFSVGGDGIILIMPSKTADFRMRMFNADGSEGSMCGNGVRCIAKYVYDKGLTDKKEISLETKAGIKILNVKAENGKTVSVTVDMGEPIITSKDVPVKTDLEKVIAVKLLPNLTDLAFTCVSMGNPHAVSFVDKITDAQVLELGPKIEKNEIFPERINVEFVEVISRKEVKMRVWERGSGETQACGTGACAVAVSAILNNLCDRDVTVHLLGGDLQITWSPNNHVFMTGPAEIAFEGIVEVEI